MAGAQGHPCGLLADLQPAWEEACLPINVLCYGVLRAPRQESKHVLWPGHDGVKVL